MEQANHVGGVGKEEKWMDARQSEEGKNPEGLLQNERPLNHQESGGQQDAGGSPAFTAWQAMQGNSKESADWYHHQEAACVEAPETDEVGPAIAEVPPGDQERTKQAEDCQNQPFRVG